MGTNTLLNCADLADSSFEKSRRDFEGTGLPWYPRRKSLQFSRPAGASSTGLRVRGDCFAPCKDTNRLVLLVHFLIPTAMPRCLRMKETLSVAKLRVRVRGVKSVVGDLVHPRLNGRATPRGKCMWADELEYACHFLVENVVRRLEVRTPIKSVRSGCVQQLMHLPDLLTVVDLLHRRDVLVNCA